MADIPPLVDIHCHLLPEIDDGASGWDETLAMAQMYVTEGAGTLVVTPHQLGNYAHNSGHQIRELTAQTQQFLHQHHIPLELLPGADVRIDGCMLDGLQSGEVLTLGDHRRHVLLELPHELYMPLEPLLDKLDALGIVGILSHPERNQGILQQPEVLGPLVDTGCLMQVTAGSFIGAFGANVQRFAEQMLHDGLIHFVSTDAHGAQRRRPLMRKPFQRVAALTNHQTAVDLFCNYPAAIASGRHVPGGRRKSTRSRSWLPWKRAA